MPNYVKNVIQFAQGIPQDRINALYKTILNTHPVTGERDWFDFNTLVPMPKDLDIESGSNNEIGMLLYRLVNKGTTNVNSPIRRILDAQGCWDVFLRMICKRSPGNIEHTARKSTRMSVRMPRPQRLWQS